MLILLMFPRSVQDELNAELADLEQEVLDERLSGADRVPVTSPTSKEATGKPPFLPKLWFSHSP
jgi:hypothetical protein